jgi:hypothetical protein
MRLEGLGQLKKSNDRSNTPLSILVSAKGLAMEEKRGKSYCLWEMQLLCNT